MSRILLSALIGCCALAGAAAEEISARQAAVGGSWAHHGNELVPRR